MSDEFREMAAMSEEDEESERDQLLHLAAPPAVDSNSPIRPGPTASTASAAAAVRAKRVTRFDTHYPEVPSSGSAGRSLYRLRQPQSDSNLRSKRQLMPQAAGAEHHAREAAAPTLRFDQQNEEPVVYAPAAPPCPGLWGEDLCQLCKSFKADGLSSSGAGGVGGEGEGVGLQLDDRPGIIRWRKLPCRCPDRYLHVSCLTTAFFDEAVYSRGRRRLHIRCSACSERFVVTHHRGRRSCDSVACTSFARHLLLAGVTAGALLGFGLWSMLHPIEGRPRLVNSGMVAAGCLILVVFAMYEVWLLYCRYEFVINRVDGGADKG